MWTFGSAPLDVAMDMPSCGVAVPAGRGGRGWSMGSNARHICVNCFLERQVRVEEQGDTSVRQRWVGCLKVELPATHPAQQIDHRFDNCGALDCSSPLPCSVLVTLSCSGHAGRVAFCKRVKPLRHRGADRSPLDGNRRDRLHDIR